MRAALLAAGRGVRIGADIPKTLVPIGPQRPLFDYLLDGLKRSGISDLLIVTGFRPDAIAQAATAQWGEEGLTFVFNARYASWGNFHSVRLALDQSPGADVLVVNSDIVISPEVYGRVLSSWGDLVLAVQRRDRLDEEDMRVELDGTRVAAISKSLKLVRSHGEYAGVSLLRRDAARVYLQLATDAEWRATTGLYYEDIYAQMIGRVDVRAAEVGPGEYAEVDTPADYASAEQVIEGLFTSPDAS
ncbi:MAG TPA: NTP transferase domain-containing protein [Actinomycetota bacterium]|nr:NTP transferase domain-containing protein [Actinomycetota bacterium]